MYSVDNLDQVVRMDGVPLPETGAPLPIVVADEHGVVLSYLPDDSSQQVGSEVEFTFVRFKLPLMHMFGPPNDEALQGHPLWGRGLDYSEVFRVEQSSLIRRLALMNRVHPHYNLALFEKKNHYVFTFHDSTLECVAESVETEQMKCGWKERQSRMQEWLSPDPVRPISTQGRITPSFRTKLRWPPVLLLPTPEI